MSEQVKVEFSPSPTKDADFRHAEEYVSKALAEISQRDGIDYDLISITSNPIRLNNRSYQIEYKSTDENVVHQLFLKQEPLVENPDISDDEYTFLRTLEHAQLEQSVLERLSSKGFNIVPVIDTQIVDDFQYILMEKLTGPSVLELLKSDFILSRAQLISLVKGPILNGLVKLHELEDDSGNNEGMAVGDINLGTFMFPSAVEEMEDADLGQVVVLDLGNVQSNTPFSSLEYARKSSRYGAPGYRAPEKVISSSGETISDQISDVYMTFQVLHVLLTRRYSYLPPGYTIFDLDKLQFKDYNPFFKDSLNQRNNSVSHSNLATLESAKALEATAGIENLILFSQPDQDADPELLRLSQQLVALFAKALNVQREARAEISRFNQEKTVLEAYANELIYILNSTTDETFDAFVRMIRS